MENTPPEIPALKEGGALPPDLRAGGDAARVLVVDDDPGMLASLSGVIGAMGLQVVAVSSGREALRQLLLTDFALILLDVNMPGLDGFETAALIHGRPRSAHLPVIFVTAEANSNEELFRGYQLGAVDFIFSPVLPDILRAKVQVFADLYYLNRQLQQQTLELKRHSEEIHNKNRQLEEVSRAKSDFLANMSHELRTPLNAIIGFAEILKDGLGGPLQPEQNEYIGEIFDSGQHLLSLINDILDLSKVEAGHMELDLEQVELGETMKSCLTIVKEKALKHGIALNLDLSAAPDKIVADQRKLKQIVYNLLSNAVKFTADGGAVTLTLRRQLRSAVQLEAPPGMSLRQLPLPDNEWPEFVEIRVTDSGMGIAQSDLERLFQTFMQLDASLERKYEGTGLGLALVKRLTMLHGGTVAAASAPGMGSCFAVWLPLRALPQPENLVDASPLTSLTKPERSEKMELVALSKNALVIEDNPQAAEILRVNLESAGFAVSCAPDADSGLKMAEQVKPDLITLDLLLPGTGGWEALERIKATPALAAVPVVIASIVAERNSGFAVGAAKILQKPLRRAELLAALRDIGFSGRPRSHYTILAVDDDPKTLDMLGLHFSSYKRCTLLRAADGRTAIDMLHQAVPDLVILDLLMPGLSGFDVLDTIRHDPTTVNVPILVLTAKEITAEDRQRLAGKVLTVIEKSHFDHQHFLVEVGRALLGR